MQIKSVIIFIAIVKYSVAIPKQNREFKQPSKHPHFDLRSKMETAFNQTMNTKRVKENELTDDLENWKSPDYLGKNFPYYLSGYDDASGSPIWFSPIGKMDLRSLIEQGGEMVQQFEIYAQQAAYRIMKSIRNASREDRRVNEALFLLDCDGLSIRQVTYLPNLIFVLKIAFRYSELALNHVGPSAVVNVNFLAETVIRIVKPVFGSALANVEIYGTNKNKWMPEVRRIFGEERIPYHKNFKPLAVYG